MSPDGPLISIIVQVVLIAINAFFACAEISIISLNELMLKKKADEGDIKSKRILLLLGEPTKFLATIQIGITLAGFLGSAFAADNFSYKLTDVLKNLNLPIPDTILSTISLVIVTLIISLFTLIFGELVPKRVAMKNSEKVSRAICNVIYVLAKVTSPIVGFLNGTTNAVLRIIGIDPNDNGEEVTEEEIRAMVDAGSQSGSIAPEEREMIENIFEFNNKTVEEIMIHRTDMDVLWLDDDLEKWEHTFTSSNHSYLPVCGESIDDIVGALSVKAFYAAIRKGVNSIEKMTEFIKKPFFIPEYVTIDILFKNMQKTKNRFVFVLDEYGGLSGIITMNDILEEIVGDFDDDEMYEEQIVSVSENIWRIKGVATLEDIEEALNIKFPEHDDFDTLGGLIINELKAIPNSANIPAIEVDGLKLQVLEVKARRIEWVMVEKLEPIEKEDQDKQ